MSLSWPLQDRVKPHQWSRSISAHRVSDHPSLCRKDSVRLMGGRHGDKPLISLEDACLFCFLLGEVLHHLQLLHWFPLLVDGDKLQENASKFKLGFSKPICKSSQNFVYVASVTSTLKLQVG